MAAFEGVFKTVGGIGVDTHRTQSRLPDKPADFSISMKLLHQEVKQIVQCFERDLEFRTYSFLRSDEGGDEQAPHQDYHSEAIALLQRQAPGIMSASIIIALEEGTMLKVFPGCFTNVDMSAATTVYLRPGDAITWRGD
ncbi:hypothetical protein PHYBOEH_002729 [Phytophthora boehmeriae]|uniref:Uncharacterized protein n=1 Tax=Phytophthora boehmeriae TaxID=109152 RepID=A0A8T1X688_9STRA|nr:hypothetical protein PHYBOEH_002729 [Phytophthora boehmeriae]